MRRALLATCSFTAVVLLACGSRGPLDDGLSVVAVTTDGGTDATSISPDATPLTDATAPQDAGPLACAGCVIESCGQQIVDCVGDPSCLGVFTCITSTCLPSGDAGASGINTSCLLGCAGKNPTGALQVIQIFQCVTGTCSAGCGDLLGGLGGGLGGLGGLLGGGQKLVADEPVPFDREAFDQAFSPWPQLTSQQAGERRSLRSRGGVGGEAPDVERK